MRGFFFVTFKRLGLGIFASIKTANMLTIEYLQQILTDELTEVTDMEEQVIESAAGYDGIVALIQKKGISPMVILENSEVGELSVRPGGFDKTSQSIWVMKMVSRDGNRRATQNECHAMMVRIVSIFNKRYEKKDQKLKQWECDRIPYGIRNAGPNYTGYEFTVFFSEDTDLSYNPLTEGNG